MSFAVSVIIPTYKRPDSVLLLLESLAKQTLVMDQLEVIVVDDGSAYDEAIVKERPFPFSLTYIRQKNQGATIARNNGAQHSTGDVLVFIDDDVTVSSQAIEVLANRCHIHDKIVALGNLTNDSREVRSPFANNAIEQLNRALPTEDQFVKFTWSNTQLLAVLRQHFFELEMIQDPTGGWPNWDDVDFGYRAHLAGFRLLQCADATGTHWDYSLSNLKPACRRWWRACHSAVKLFEVHPGLQPHIPMLIDKVPIDFQADAPKLILRKVFRRITASSIAIGGMEKLTAVLESRFPQHRLLPLLYLWIQGGYMFRGYQAGLKGLPRV